MERRNERTVQRHGRVVREVTRAEAILQKIGNQAPYFSVTGTISENGREAVCGCMHGEILAVWPDLADVVALHLSDDTGAPMHAQANAWYFAGGVPDMRDARNRWTLQRHLRCSDSMTEQLLFLALHGKREEFNRHVDALRPWWKHEADAVIAKYGLTVQA